MKIAVHPSFDGKVWSTEYGEAPSLRALQKLLGSGFKIEGYYPDGYGTVWFDKGNSALGTKVVFAKKLPPIMKPAKGPGSRSKMMKYDHESMLNMWAAGKTGPEIGAALGMKNWRSIGMVLQAARKRGDKRAEKRTKKPEWGN